MEYYDRIRAKRIERQMTTTQLADKIGYNSRQAVIKLENGETDLPVSRLELVAEALGVSIGELFGEKPDTESLSYELEHIILMKEFDSLDNSQLRKLLNYQKYLEKELTNGR